MIYVPDTVGSPKSVTASLGLVYDVYEKSLLNNENKKICLYGNFVLNEQVKKEFNELGIVTLYNVNDISKDNIVILNSYGVSKKIYEYLNDNNIEYYDGTNKTILKLQKEIENKYNDGYEIVLVGDYNDYELINLNSYCDNNGIFVSREEDFVKLSNNPKKYLISSSNCNKEKFKNIYKVIENNYSGLLEKYEIKNDFEQILKESIKLSQNCDLMIIVGDNTPDTKELINNIPNNMVFNNINDFFKYIINNGLKNNIGITAGKNVPIKEVYNYKYLLSFVNYYKKCVNKLEKNQDKINLNLIDKNDNCIVEKVINDFIDLNKDGKYIRGTLIGLGEYLSSNRNSNFLNLALAYEMFQTSVLIHDDIIDNAKVRRGKETIPRRVCQQYLSNINDKCYQMDTLKYANSIGICAGDFGFYEANKLIIDSYKDNKNLAKIMSVYNDIVIKTIKGEIIDVTLPFLNKYNYYISEEKDIIDIYHLKTSVYTLIGPIMLGYALNGKEVDNNLYNILNKIGLSFQIKDDILGIFGSENKMGKSNISDIEEFKQTLLYSHIITTPYKEEFLKLYGKKNISYKELKRIRELLQLSESIEYVNDYLNNLSETIISEIDNLKISSEGKDILKGLILYVNIREK